MPNAPRHPPRRPPRARAGLTLVELLVALVVLAVGVLALAGVALAVFRAAADAELAARAAARLEARADSLHLLACADGAGVVDDGAIRETWSARLDGDLLRLADTVTYARPGRAPRTVALATARWCDR